MTATDSGRVRDLDLKLEVAKYLWEEFKYRHDLIWRLLFRITAVAALISIVPFTIGDLAESRAHDLVKYLPVLATGLVLAGWAVLLVELRLFTPVDRCYVEAQRDALGEVRKGGWLDGLFVWVVSLYPGLLLALTGFVWWYVWSRHPHP
jgi:hypothetical protein